MFQKLINTIKSRKDAEAVIEREKKKFEEMIEPLNLLLKKITVDEEQLRKEVLETLKENKETNVVVDNSSITLSTKITPKIVDTESVYHFIADNKKEVEKEFGVDFDSLPLQMKFETSFINKKEALEFVGQYKKIFDTEIPGLEEQKTEYLTIQIK